MKKLATLFSESSKEFKHVSTLTTSAVFVAISIVLSYFTWAFGDYIKIGFSTIAGQLVYYLFGPVVGGCFGAAKDLMGYVIKPTAGFFPGFTLSSILAGVIYGMFFYKSKLTIGRVLAAEFTVSLICNILLGTLWLTMMYNKGFMALVPVRIIKNLIMWPINSLVFFSIAKTMETTGIFRLLRYRYHYNGADKGMINQNKNGIG